jgi:hypothetical protein
VLTDREREHGLRGRLLHSGEYEKVFHKNVAMFRGPTVADVGPPPAIRDLRVSAAPNPLRTATTLHFDLAGPARSRSISSIPRAPRAETWSIASRWGRSHDGGRTRALLHATAFGGEEAFGRIVVVRDFQRLFAGAVRDDARAQLDLV